MPMWKTFRALRRHTRNERSGDVGVILKKAEPTSQVLDVEIQEGVQRVRIKLV
jgi:hypothetical protein